MTTMTAWSSQPRVVNLATPAPRTGYLPSYIAWHGTQLEGTEVAAAVSTTGLALRRLGIDSSSTVVLEADHTGRTIVTLLAVANVGASVVLVDELARLRTVPEAPVLAGASRVTLKAGSAADAHDLRSVFREIERGDLQRGPSSLATRVDLTPWFSRPRALGLFSSGTTSGVPTLVWKSGPALLENAHATVAALDYRPEDIFLPLLPLTGQYGSSAVVIAAVIGAGVATCSRSRLGEILRTVDRHQVTCVDGTPVLYRALLDELRKRPAGVGRLGSVRVFGVGGEGLTRRLQDDFRALAGRSLTDGYGLTQLGNVAFASTPESDSFTPVAPYRVTVLDSAGAVTAEGEVGRVMVGRTDGLPPVEGTSHQWFDTGDVGRMTSAGLTVLGRRGMINRGGTLVSLAWVEAALAAEGVDAIAVPEEGEHSSRYWMFVQDSLHRPRELWREHVAQVLPDDQRPDHLRVIGNLPIDASGKVSRSRLAAMARGLSEARGSQQCSPDSAAGRLRAAVRRSREELIGLIESVSDRATAQRDYWSLVNVLNHANGELGLYSKPPSVPVNVFFPRNALLESFAIYCLVPSLWATEVRLRPAHGTETIMARVVELLGKAAPCPVTVDTSAQSTFVDSVAAQPSLVLFTGRRSNAESILRRLGDRHVFLFFGRGVNPIVVNRGADLAAVAKDVIISRLFNGGQDCLAPDLVLVHERIADDLVRHVVDAAETYLRTNEGTLAPLVKDETLMGALSYLTANADALVAGGTVDYRRRTFTPAVLTVGESGRVRPVEHFAPIVSLATFGSTSEVMDLLQTPYYLENGFGVSMYAFDEAVARSLAGHYMVALDQSLADAATPYEPFGGHGVESGFVVHRGRRICGPINITRAAVEFGSTIAEAN